MAFGNNERFIVDKYTREVKNRLHNITRDISGQVRSVAKALMIIDMLSYAPEGMPLGEIARKIGAPKSTIHGLLSTLCEYGFVEQSSIDGCYKLGVHLFELGMAVADNWDVRKIAAPYIERLLGEMQETIHLVILDNGEVLYIDKRESNQSLRIVSKIGARLPAHCTGVGKVLLAYMPPAEVKTIIERKGLSKYTRNTITDPYLLEKELQKIRHQGYAIDNEEIMDGLRCVAAPIRDHKGDVCAAISISGPAVRLDEDRLPVAIDRVTKTADEISAALGNGLLR